MKCKILHESAGRMRVHIEGKRPTMAQADLLENYLLSVDGICDAKVYDRTGDIVALDESGLIQFKGRKDSLIKHLGYRIELGEVEHVIVNEIKIVEYCCVVYNHKEKVITLFYEGDEISKTDFRNRLKDVFPNYMLPGEYIHMNALPRNNNGKIDRNRLNREVND